MLFLNLFQYFVVLMMKELAKQMKTESLWLKKELAVVGEPAVAANDQNLLQAPDAVFRIWRNRERIEYEAASVFQQLGQKLLVLYGQEDPISKLSFKAYEDEIRHANRCIEILSHSPVPLKAVNKNIVVSLGPKEWSVADQVLYASVAMGCITESLSAALLTNMHKKAGPGLIKEVVHEILVDEVSHGRIGWAELSRVAEGRDISWLSQHLPAMFSEAIASDVSPMLGLEKEDQDYSQWGILKPSFAKDIMIETMETVILPGLQHFGVNTESSIQKIESIIKKELHLMPV